MRTNQTKAMLVCLLGCVFYAATSAYFGIDSTLDLDPRTKALWIVGAMLCGLITGVVAGLTARQSNVSALKQIANAMRGEPRDRAVHVRAS